MVTWFIEQKNNDPIAQRLCYLVQELGNEIITKPYIPFQETHDFSFLPTDRPVVFYGSINMVKSFNKSPQKGFVRPFCWFDFEEMSCRSYYTHWGKHLLQKHYSFYTLGEIKRLKDSIYNLYERGNCIFIRPDTNDKAFTGEVVEYNYFDSWFKIQQDWGVGLLQLCVISSPEPIEAEYRLAIADGKVISASRYRLNRSIDKALGCPKNVFDFAEEVIATVPWQPAPIYCMDIALSNETPRLVEIGEINCAGFYEMDLKTIAEKISEIATREFCFDK
jgi:hypothetical protein